MGIESTWDGSIDFRPAFSIKELKGTIYENPQFEAFEFALITQRDDEYVADEDGWEVRKTRIRVVGIRAAYENNFRGYNMQTQIQAFIDTLKGKRVMPTRFYGYIEKLTEDGGLSRFYVRDGVVHEVEATISYPGWEDGD